MAKRRCQRCEREQSDAAMICAACTHEIHKALTGISDLYPNLLEAIGRQTAMGERTGGKPTPTPATIARSRL